MIVKTARDDWSSAQFMIRLYGDKAEQIAAGYADACGEKGEAVAREKWWRITAIIAGIRDRPEIS